MHRARRAALLSLFVMAAACERGAPSASDALDPREAIAVGDIDGDGTADAIVPSLADSSELNTTQATVYVLYGGRRTGTVDEPGSAGRGSAPESERGMIDRRSLPRLSGDLGGPVVSVTVAPAGDVNGDGLADFWIGNNRPDACANPSRRAGDDEPFRVYLVFGSAHRFSGATALSAVGVVVRPWCTAHAVLDDRRSSYSDGTMRIAPLLELM